MRTVFVNGCFDVLTYGHLKLFEYAKSLGDRLAVAIDSDDRIKERKGSIRPFHNVSQRIFNLRSIRHVDYVVVFSNDEELERMVEIIKPDAMVVGDEYKDKKVIGAEYAKEVYFFDLPRVTSSTEIINKLTK